MNTSQLLQSQFETIKRQLPAVMEDLTREQLCWRPSPQVNSIGFLVWHILRTWDGYNALLYNQEEIYEEEGWAQRFGFDTTGRGVEGSGMGTGFTPDDVAIIDPKPELLLEYMDVLFKQTRTYLSGASEESLAEPFRVPWWPNEVPVARVNSHIIGHSYFHLGEAQYARGLMEAHEKHNSA
jgi:hypothetical protein